MTIDNPQEIKLANTAQRYFAAFIDYFILLLLCFPVGMIFGEKFINEDGGVGVHLKGYSMLIIMVIWFVMFPIAEGLTGQTIGKVVFKLKVVNQATLTTSFSKSLVRHLFDFVDYLPFFGIVGILVSSGNLKKKRVGDLVANTIVVKK